LHSLDSLFIIPEIVAPKKVGVSSEIFAKLPLPLSFSTSLVSMLDVLPLMVLQYDKRDTFTSETDDGEDF